MAQARVLLALLDEHVAETSKALIAAECRLSSTIGRPAALQHQRQRAVKLRKDLHEARRLIEALHRRFPVTRAPSRSAGQPHTVPAHPELEAPQPI